MPFFTPFVQVSLFLMLFTALAMMMYRLLHGPHILDRIMAVDAAVVVMLCLMAMLELVVGTSFFFDALLVLCIVGFISTVVLTRYVQEGDIID